MLRITVEHRTPKIATAGVAVLAGPNKTQLPATLLAALTAATLLAGTTACSTDKNSKTPKINQAAPKTAAAPLPAPQTASTAPTPPISEAEGKGISQRYFDLSKQATSSHSIKALEDIETGAMLEVSKARQERILKYGDSVPSSEEKAANDDIQVVTPQGAPNGSDRWLLAVGRQSLSGKSRTSVGVLQQARGSGPWRMSFLTYTGIDQEMPKVAQIATLNDAPDITENNIDYGEDTCRSFTSYMNGESTPAVSWGPRTKSARQVAEQNKQGMVPLTAGGAVAARTEPLPDGRIPAWRTSDGDKLVMCTTKTTSHLTPGPSGVITVTRSEGLQNLNGRTTKWKTLDLTTVNMVVLKVPPPGNSAVDIVADSYRALSGDGTPA
ncbi:hypothetical protein [Embleya scabrispora]|uniref:hypothetical protein n=1 Tax=Embleya scabrispora TaxID=159449 RepID=UPI001319BB59|nr:hypothetical protein [Embleya scabrispora]MYS84196.1 hypothetical protein [Streptomyces sp. SID5474]